MLQGSCVIPHERIIETGTDTDKCHFVSTEPDSKDGGDAMRAMLVT
jgi:hypothetical protein